MRLEIKMLLALVLTFILIAPLNLVFHEYIHYRQASCESSFWDRVGWGWEEDKPKDLPEGTLAYMDIRGCSKPLNVNEIEPMLFNFIFTFVVLCLASDFVIRSWTREREREIQKLKRVVEKY